MEVKMKNVAILGGSFDPPHIGHMMIVAHLNLNHKDIDDVFIIPCFQQLGKKLISFDHRFEMANLAFATFNRVKVLPVEKELGGESITSRTILELIKQYPDCKFRFVIGADLQEKIKTWEGADVIEKFAPPITIGRAGIPNSADATPISPLVSSTMVRNALDEGRLSEVERFLSKDVFDYIARHSLYVKSK